MQLKEFFDYKNKLMEDILTNEIVVNLLNEDVDMEHAAELAYSQVFPFEFLPDTIEHGHTFICFDVDLQATTSKTFLSPVLYVWVFTHKSKLRLPEGGVRTDRLASELADMLNGSRFYGLGELDLYSVKRFAPATDFNGKMIVFHATDFNRFSPSGKPVPTNRKRG